MTKPEFEPGNNIVIKVPSHQYNRTVAFYKDVLGLKPLDIAYPDQFESIAFKFGDKNLWVDNAAELSQSEIWLEIKTDNVEKAAEYFNEHQVVRRDDIESVSESIKGFWLSNPTNIIHLINE
jgi:catechol 2,3-dioxygenase-like lactoylglutathione lyase family enzyme